MPKEIKDIRDFLTKARRKDARLIKIGKDTKTGKVKFKIRCSKFLYTLAVDDPTMSEKLIQSLPPGVPRKDLLTSIKRKDAKSKNRRK